MTRAVAVLVVVGAVGAMAIPAAGQEVPEEDEEVLLPESYLDAYAWWSKFQQAPQGGQPLPSQPCPSPPPETPPEVPTANQCPVLPPQDGLYVVYDYEAAGQTEASGVAGNPIGPLNNLPTTPTTAPPPDDKVPTVSPPKPLGAMAYGAVRYYVPEGAETSLQLQILSRNTTQPGGVEANTGLLYACLAEPGWSAIQNGRYDQAPKFDCSSADEATIEGDAAVFEFAPSMIQNGTIDVAIVGQGKQPFQMSFGPPTESSLTILNAAELAGEEELLLDDDFVIEDPLEEFLAEEALNEDVLDGFDSFGGELALTVPDDGVNRPFAPVARPTPRRIVNTGLRNPFGPDASRGERLMAVAILMLMAAALWWYGGQPTRLPRLLGSLADGRTSEPTIGDRGIGRFAKPRTGRPRRLF